MFVALAPPTEVREQLEDFLSSRPEMPWISAEQWHITLAFMESVPEYREEELIERLHAGYSRKQPFEMRLDGAGCFPDPSRAKVLWMRPVATGADLKSLAVTARGAAVKSGAPVDGRKFTGHLSVARLRRPIEAAKWLQILDTFVSSTWTVDQIGLVASYLRERPGRRPRYETVAAFPLGGR